MQEKYFELLSTNKAQRYVQNNRKVLFRFIGFLLLVISGLVCLWIFARRPYWHWFASGSALVIIIFITYAMYEISENYLVNKRVIKLGSTIKKSELTDKTVQFTSVCNQVTYMELAVVEVLATDSITQKEQIFYILTEEFFAFEKEKKYKVALYKNFIVEVTKNEQ